MYDWLIDAVPNTSSYDGGASRHTELCVDVVVRLVWLVWLVRLAFIALESNGGADG